MTSQFFFNMTLFFYMTAMMFFFVFAAIRKKGVGLASILLTYAGFTTHTCAIALRWKESYDIGLGHPPLTNLYESAGFFSWAITLLYLYMDMKYKSRIVGVFALPLALLGIAGAGVWLNSDIEPLVPALKSDWLLFHVITCLLGYAAFAIACCASIMYLFKARYGAGSSSNKLFAGLAKRLPEAVALDALNYRTVAIGFLFLTIGIITGSIWAHYAWGSYWSWDSKETWSLIVWLIYAAFLHARFTRGWEGKRAAWLSIVGFAATLFCYLGVNLFMSGLHSYGGL